MDTEFSSGGKKRHEGIPSQNPIADSWSKANFTLANPLSLVYLKAILKTLVKHTAL